MTRNEVTDRFRAVVVEQTGVNAEQVVDGASFVDDLCLDSLDTIELIMAVEDEFDIDVPDEEAEKLTTFGAAVEWLAEKLKTA